MNLTPSQERLLKLLDRADPRYYEPEEDERVDAKRLWIAGLVKVRCGEFYRPNGDSDYGIKLTVAGRVLAKKLRGIK